LSKVTEAGEPGSISIKGSGKMQLDGEMQGLARGEALRGGTLFIEKTDLSGKLSVSIDSLRRFREGGFDALSLASAWEIILTGTGDASFGRSFTLSAPRITASGSDRIGLSAPWIMVGNNAPAMDLTSPMAGDARIHLSGLWLDVKGDVLFSGFQELRLEAARDLTLTDSSYRHSTTNMTVWSGMVRTAGDLTLKAARIYPTTLSRFIAEAGGKVTILPPKFPIDAPIFSAGGSLTIRAGGGIEHGGVLAAPLGSISLQATGIQGTAGRVFLAEGSVTTTQGDAPVLYGAIQPSLGENIWGIFDKSNPNVKTPYLAVEGPPVKSVSLLGKEVIMREGARVDISGGGSVYTYQFLSWLQGSVNPLEKAGRSVILPDQTVQLPGNAVYLAGAKDLPAGVYSILPKEYAFLPGAMIVTALGTDIAGDARPVSKEGYSILPGFATFMGTDIRAARFKAYEVRPASEVLKEGNFPMQSFTAGEAGRVTLAGNTTITDGTIQAKPLPGFDGGLIVLSGSSVTVQPSSVPLPAGFGFGSEIPREFAGTLNIAASALSGKGFRTIGIGYSNVDDPAGSIAAEKVTLKEGAVLEAEKVILAAGNLITLETGSRIFALTTNGNRGEASLVSPLGKAVIEAGAEVRASDAVALQTAELDLRGTLQADNSTLNLKGTRISFIPDNFDRSSVAGLAITESQWKGLSSFENIGLISASDLFFQGDFNLAVRNELTIDAGRVSGLDSGSTVRIGASVIRLLNSGVFNPAPGADRAGWITFEAPEMEIGKGSVLLDPFSSVSFIARNNLTLRGEGSLRTGGGDLSITAARVTTSYYLEPAGTDRLTNVPLPPIYTAANFKVDAGGGRVLIQGSGGVPGTTADPGGILEISGKTIAVSTRVEIPSGVLRLTAPENIALLPGAGLSARGSDIAPGGVVSLRSSGSGAVNMEAGAFIDISAGAQGDSGVIDLYGPSGGVMLAGSLLGTAGPGGRGGSLRMVAKAIDDFSSLNRKLAAGGFDETLDVRARSSDLMISAGETVRFRNLKVAADGGSIHVSGAIDSSGPKGGGIVELYAQNDLSIAGTVSAKAAGGDADGGIVSLGVNGGMLDFMTGSLIDVSGSGTGKGGEVLFRGLLAGPSYNRLDMILAGTVNGASTVAVEAVRAYTNVHSMITSASINSIKQDTSTFMNSYAGGLKTALLKDLTGVQPAMFHLRPGILIQQNAGNGDLALSQDWDLSDPNQWRFAGEPGSLTLRAAGNLTINGKLVDAPASFGKPYGGYSTLWSGSMQTSWGFRLVAGAQADSPDFMALTPAFAQGSTPGRLTISPQKLVYTESGLIGFASGGDTVIHDGPPTSHMVTPNMRYSLATYGGQVRGDVAGNLTVNGGGAVQSAIGDIDLRVGGNLLLQRIYVSTPPFLGAIRTTGEHAPGKTYQNYDTYTAGGGIRLRVGGSVQGELTNLWLTTATDFSKPWHRWVLPIYTISPSSSPTEGIVAMAGGDVDVQTGGSFSAQAGTFGKGDLRVLSGGDLKGRFLVKDGTGDLIAMGNFGAPSRRAAGSSLVKTEPQLIELFNARMNVSAQGNVEIGAILNPTLARSMPVKYWDNQYAPDSSVKLTSVRGDVNLHGSVDQVRYGQFYDSANSWNLIMPPLVEVSAGRDINLKSGRFVLLPSRTGNLTMIAGNDIIFSNNAGMVLSDADMNQVYVPYRQATPQNPLPNLESHASPPVHAPDAVPVRIIAGRDLKTADLVIPKNAQIRAGKDIIDLMYSGQNIQGSDVTRVSASRDILYGYSSNVQFKKIELGGPGYLIVEAGGEIDLGNTQGIQAIGNYNNRALSQDGSSVIVAAGLNRELTPGEAISFFDRLRAAGTEYSGLQAQGDKAGAERRIIQAREEVISPFLGTLNGKGGINMTASQISTSGGGSLFILATGTLNVGKTSIGGSTGATSAAKQTGIFTSTGGAINVFAAGDVNVNEARIMTFRGGDITVWSDTGDINAGRGDKAVINMGSPVYSCDKETGVCSLQISPPAIGSGIRALSYDPDDAGPLVAPPAGDAYLFAPQGIIDAGEAGISGKNVILGATAVLNVQNISFGVGSVGVPVQTQSVNLGALSGSSSLTPKTTVSEDVGSPVARGRSVAEATQAIEEIVMKWLDVKVVDYDLSRGAVGEEEEKK
jgi:hypothetical protein